MLLDVFEQATKNAAALEEQYRAMLDGESAQNRSLLERFASHVEGGCIATNMKQMTTIASLSLGQYWNTYDLAAWKSEFSSYDERLIAEHQLGGHAIKRFALDGVLAHSRNIKYGVLVTLSAGIPYHGEFCIVFDCLENLAGKHLAFVHGDSLRRYVGESGDVDAPALSRDAATFQCKHFLATLKMAEDIAGSGQTSWPSLLTRKESYMEALFCAEISRHNVAEIRVQDGILRKWYNLAFEDMTGVLDEKERILVKAFQVILQLAEEHGVAIRGVPS